MSTLTVSLKFPTQHLHIGILSMVVQERMRVLVHLKALACSLGSIFGRIQAVNFEYVVQCRLSKLRLQQAPRQSVPVPSCGKWGSMPLLPGRSFLLCLRVELTTIVRDLSWLAKVVSLSAATVRRLAQSAVRGSRSALRSKNDG